MFNWRDHQMTNEETEKICSEILLTYGLGEVQRTHLIRGFFGTTHIGCEASSGKYVIKFLKDPAKKEQLFLEKEISEYLLDQGVLVSEILEDTAGKIVNTILVKDIEVEYLVQSFIYGDTYRFGDITEQQLSLAVETTAKMHHLLDRFVFLTPITKHTSVYIQTLESLDVDDLMENVANNYADISEEKMNEIYQFVNRDLNTLLSRVHGISKHPNLIIHGDLNPGNYIFSGSNCGLLDFHDTGYGNISWDIAIAFASWYQEQEIYEFSAFYDRFKTLYQQFNPAYDWNDDMLLWLLKGFFFYEIVIGLREAKREVYYDWHKSSVLDGIEGLKTITLYEKAISR